MGLENWRRSWKLSLIVSSIRGPSHCCHVKVLLMSVISHRSVTAVGGRCQSFPIDPASHVHVQTSFSSFHGSKNPRNCNRDFTRALNASTTIPLPFKIINKSSLHSHLLYFHSQLREKEEGLSGREAGVTKMSSGLQVTSGMVFPTHLLDRVGFQGNLHESKSLKEIENRHSVSLSL